MTDHLLQFCVDMDIELFYTNSTSPIMSSYVQDGTRNIVANNVFRGCSKELAAAVVDYYTQEKGKDMNFNRIKEFLKYQFKSGTWKVDSVDIVLDEKEEDLEWNLPKNIVEDLPAPKEQTKKSKGQKEIQDNQKPRTPRKKKVQEDGEIKEETEAKPKTNGKKTNTSRKKKKPDEKKGIIEADIKNMTKKSFKENTTVIQTNESIKLTEDDVVELDITIDPFNT